MRAKGVLFMWWRYFLSRFGNSVDKRVSVQEAIANGRLNEIQGLSDFSEEQLKQLVFDIRGAARDYYFKGRVPEYYRPILKKYYRSVLYHLLFQRNFD